jgi:hypothetical protein
VSDDNKIIAAARKLNDALERDRNLPPRGQTAWKKPTAQQLEAVEAGWQDRDRLIARHIRALIKKLKE